MKLAIARAILFVKDMHRVSTFYENVVGLDRIPTPDDSADFLSFDAGGCQLSLHTIPKRYAAGIEIQDPPEPRHASPSKLAFYSEDVEATRNELLARGAAMGRVLRSGTLELCDGTDPEGNLFQISNRP